jgi:hypothetical protein
VREDGGRDKTENKARERGSGSTFPSTILVLLENIHKIIHNLIFVNKSMEEEFIGNASDYDVAN